MNFVKWFRSEPHRDKYEADHPAFLAAREAWDASKKDRQWVSVTDDEIKECNYIRDKYGPGSVCVHVWEEDTEEVIDLFRVVEAKLKEKNT